MPKVSCPPSCPRDASGHAVLTYLGWWFRCSFSPASPSFSPFSFSTESYVDSARFLNLCRLWGSSPFSPLDPGSPSLFPDLDPPRCRERRSLLAPLIVPLPSLPCRSAECRWVRCLRCSFSAPSSTDPRRWCLFPPSWPLLRSLFPSLLPPSTSLLRLLCCLCRSSLLLAPDSPFSSLVTSPFSWSPSLSLSRCRWCFRGASAPSAELTLVCSTSCTSTGLSLLMLFLPSPLGSTTSGRSKWVFMSGLMWRVVA